MKKMLVVISAFVMVMMAFTMVVGTASAEKNADHEYFEPVGADPVEPDSWGKITYFTSGDEFEFVFNGHGLTKGTTYHLHTRGVCLGTSTANGGGNINIAGSSDLPELPENPTAVKYYLRLWRLSNISPKNPIIRFRSYNI